MAEISPEVKRRKTNDDDLRYAEDNVEFQDLWTHLPPEVISMILGQLPYTKIAQLLSEQDWEGWTVLCGQLARGSVWAMETAEKWVTWGESGQSGFPALFGFDENFQEEIDSTFYSLLDALKSVDDLKPKKGVEGPRFRDFVLSMSRALDQAQELQRQMEDLVPRIEARYLEVLRLDLDHCRAEFYVTSALL